MSFPEKQVHSNRKFETRFSFQIRIRVCDFLSVKMSSPATGNVIQVSSKLNAGFYVNQAQKQLKESAEIELSGLGNGMYYSLAFSHFCSILIVLLLECSNQGCCHCCRAFEKEECSECDACGDVACGGQRGGE